MPGSCNRLRIPSIVSNRASKTECDSIIRKEQHRVVMMGAARVGKSSIISQFLYEKYLARYKETIEELHRGEYELPDGASLTLDILDTSGSYEFPAMRELSILKSKAFLLVYAVDDEDSWNEIAKLREQIISIRGADVPIVIVGNKIDSPDRKVPSQVTESIAIFDWECGYAECSAKENIGILTVFKQLLAQANIKYNLSPAVRRRRKSLPSYTNPSQKPTLSPKYYLKRHSCVLQ